MTTCRCLSHTLVSPKQLHRGYHRIKMYGRRSVTFVITVDLELVHALQALLKVATRVICKEKENVARGDCFSSSVDRCRVYVFQQSTADTADSLAATIHRIVLNSVWTSYVTSKSFIASSAPLSLHTILLRRLLLGRVFFSCMLQFRVISLL